MVQIWKYPLEASRVQTLALPVGAKILTVALQKGSPCLWAMVDPEKEDERPLRRIEAYGTGHEIGNESDLVYLGTTVDDAGSSLVFHFFERVIR